MTTTIASTPTSSDRPAAWRRGLASALRGHQSMVVIPIVLAVLCLAVPIFDADAYWLREGCLIAVLALVVSGVNLSFGYAGELQLGQVFMFAVGSYLTMILATRGVTSDVLLLMIIGGLSAVIIGVIVAVPSLRIGGWSLAMASFFLVIIIPDLSSVLSKYTGGLNGLTGVPYPELFGHQLGNVGLYEVTLATTFIWFACYRNLVTSRYGVVFRILRASPVLARSLGYSNLTLKTTVYALGAFPAGVAGCLFGFVSLIVQPSSFSLTLSIGAVAASVLGGVESVYGIFIGAALLQLGPEKSAGFATYSPVVYGLFLIAAAILLRQGIAGLCRQGAARLAGLLDPADSALRAADADVVEHASASQLPQVKGRRLQVRDVSKAFGGVKALREVTLAAEPGRVTALIGSNGSGKTTLLNVICGYLNADNGVVEMDGDDVSKLSAHQVARLGIGRTFQTPSIPTGVSVRDVVASGGYYRDHVGFVSSMLRLPRYWRALRSDRKKATDLLAHLGLADLALHEAAKLPLGTRRLVEVARALCGEPGVVLLDEPASGLNDDEVHRLGDILRAVAATGSTVIVIEHNFQFVTRVADQIHVLHLGARLASGEPDEIRRDPKVVESYLGESFDPDPTARVERPRSGRKRIEQSGTVDALLTLDSVRSGYGDLRVLRDVSMSIEPGTVEVVLGRNGVGKTTLLAAIAGLLPIWDGSISLEGNPVMRERSYRRASSGICLVQEGKRIFRQRTVWENVVLGSYSVHMSRRERQEWCAKVLGDFPALSERHRQRTDGLSGGQQQMVALAQALAARPKILLLDEPSAGLAPSIVDELFGRLRALADDGLTIVLVEQLAEKAVAIADHVTLLDSGQVIASGPAEQFADRAMLDAAYFGAHK